MSEAVLDLQAYSSGDGAVTCVAIDGVVIFGEAKDTDTPAFPLPVKRGAIFELADHLKRKVSWSEPPFPNRNQFFRELSHALRTQDNMDSPQGPDHATAHPVYMVQQKIRIFGVDAGYADGFEDIEETGERIGFVDRWEFVQGAIALTREGIEEYLQLNGHNLTEPRIYIASMYRVPSMIRLVEELKEEKP